MNPIQIMRDLCEAGLSQSEAHEIGKIAQKPEARCAVILKSYNIPSSHIEEHLEINSETLSNLLYIKELKDLQNKIIHSLTLIQDERYIESLVPTSIQVKLDLMNNDDTPPALKDKIASDFIDRAKGKPRQSVEVKTLNYNIDGTEKELNDKIEAVSSRIKEIEALKQKQIEASIDVETEEVE